MKTAKLINVIWTDPSKSYLKEIYIYHKKVASVRVAISIKDKIIQASKSLKTLERRGQLEALLKDRTDEYRYLIVGNYKIIYQPTPTSIYITDVFDCRQNPVKLTKRTFRPKHL